MLRVQQNVPDMECTVHSTYAGTYCERTCTRISFGMEGTICRSWCYNYKFLVKIKSVKMKDKLRTNFITCARIQMSDHISLYTSDELFRWNIRRKCLYSDVDSREGRRMVLNSYEDAIPTETLLDFRQLQISIWKMNRNIKINYTRLLLNKLAFLFNFATQSHVVAANVRNRNGDGLLAIILITGFATFLLAHVLTRQYCCAHFIA